MEQEYTTSTGYKIFYGVLALGLLVGSIIMFAKVAQLADGIPAFIFAVVAFAGAVIIAINLYKRKAFVSDESVSYQSVWGSKEFSKADIKGFRVVEKAIYIEPIVDTYGKIAIRDYASISNYKELIQWLNEHFTDLNAADYDAERNEILQDISFGRTEEDRDSILKKSRQLTMYYGFGGMGVFFFTAYAHITNPILAIVTLLYPLAGIVIMSMSKGIIRLFAKKNSAYPAIFMGLFFSSMATVLQAILNSEILSYDNLRIPAIVFAVICAAVLYYLTVKKANATLSSQIIFIILTSAVWGFGSSLLMNCALDQSSPQAYTATVTDAHISHGKSTTYHVTIGSWGQHQQEENVNVPSAFYYQVQVGGQVTVNLKKGLLNVPWFYLTK
jgi:hypothetical protein